MTMLSGTIGTVLAMVGIFSLGGIESFLGALTITLVPTTGILLVHYFLFERGIDTDSLFDRNGKYWYLRGWNPSALIAWFVVGAYAVLAPEWVVPALSSAIVAGILYYALNAPILDRLDIYTAEPTNLDSVVPIGSTSSHS